MSYIIPNGSQQFIDGNGKPFALGYVGFYSVGTLTPKTTYQDSALSVANSVVTVGSYSGLVALNADGRLTAWGSGSYRQILFDANMNLIWDKNLVGTATDIDVTNLTNSFNAFKSDLQNGIDNAKGDKLVGHNYIESPLYIKTVSDILNGDQVSLNRFLTQSDINIIKNNSGSVDITAEMQSWSSALPASKGGSLIIPKGYGYQISSPITNSQLQNWTPYEITCEEAVIVTSTISSGAVFKDNSQNIVLKGGLWIGAGKTTPTQLFSGQITQGRFEHVRISAFGSGILLNQSAAGFITNCNFGNCGSGIDITDINPDFSNTILIERNWFESCQNGVNLKNCYGIEFQTNTFQVNDYGIYALNAREIEFSGCNWFEAHAINSIYFTGTCTGNISKQTHVVGNGFYIDYANSAISNNFTPARTILQKSTNQSFSSGTTPVAAVWNNILSDPLNCFTSGTSNVFIKARGYYRITVNLNFSAVTTPAANSYIKVDLYDITTIFATEIKEFIPNIQTSISFSIPVKLINTSQIGINVTQNSGSSVNLLSGLGTQIAIELISSEY